MKPLTIDQMPESLALLHDKADRIIEMLTMLTNGYFFKDELFEWIRDGGRSALPSDQDMEEELSHGIRHKPMSSFDRTSCYPS